MGFLKKLFGSEAAKKNKEQQVTRAAEGTGTSADEQWEEVPAFIEAEAADRELVAVIATAIAAGTHPESQFVIKRISQRNPEARTVSIIAASLAAECAQDSQLLVKKISRRKESEAR